MKIVGQVSSPQEAKEMLCHEGTPFYLEYSTHLEDLSDSEALYIYAVILRALWKFGDILTYESTIGDLLGLSWEDITEKAMDDIDNMLMEEICKMKKWTHVRW